MFRLAAIGSMTLSLLAGPAAAPHPEVLPAVVPPSGQVHVSVVTVNGSGCKHGTADVEAAPDNTAFTVTYSDFLAQAGDRSIPTGFRKNCQMGVRVDIPQGFTFAIAEADYRGYADVQTGATGTERANYYFQGMSQTAVSSHVYNGPYNGDWQASDVTPVVALVFQPCGISRILQINAELIVNAGTSSPQSTSFMAMDSTDGSVNTVYHFAWRQC